ncbi:O-antigen ligase family protein [Calothrix rhizosoleniae]|uniref:O-antigen ligase family protein n=1 Tax=Calothrix rhizosoleniae TaxID=888997 RepID=UPI000B4A0D44|nr:O-antigen ligase [Calothrix rhizosoleniae]
MHKLILSLEKIFVIFALFLSTSALIPVLLEKEDSNGFSQDPFSPILFLGIYVITAILILEYRQIFLQFTRSVAWKNIWIWLLAGMAIASVLWTIEPDITLRRSILLLGTTVFGAYIAVRYNLREQLELLSWVFGSIIILSFVFAIALPNTGIMTFQEGGAHAGAWRGVMTHKNLLGRIMVLSSMVFLLRGISLSPTKQKYHWIPWLGYGLSILLILLCTSKTALIVSLTLTTIIPLYRTWRRNYTQVMPFMIAVILVVGSTAILIFDQLDVIATTLGRDLTLTGRTNIWIAMWDIIQERPLLGYGLNAVWQNWNNEATAYLWKQLEWECPYGHNGFMDLLAELGFSGLGLFLFGYIITYVKGIKWLRITNNVEGIWPLLYLAFLALYNISESTLLANNSIFWILFVSISFSIVIEYEQVKICHHLEQKSWNYLEISPHHKQ